MTTPKYYNETVSVSIFVLKGCFTNVKLSKSVGAFLNFIIFPKISGLSEHSEMQNYAYWYTRFSPGTHDFH